MASSTVRPVKAGLPTRELAHVRRGRQGLISAEDLVALARAEGLTDTEIRNMVASWEGRPWPRR
jgi:hypothetical protein